MSIQIFDFVQGSPEWWSARCGRPTASMFSAILAKGEGKTRASYMRKLAAEIITGEPTEEFTSMALERGKVMEAEARSLYEFSSDETVTQVGFILNGICGCSPDSLVGQNGGLEIKTQRADLLIETILKDEVPSEHKAQVQGNMMVSKREWWDLMVYWPKMPPFVKRVLRDEVYISDLSSAVSIFKEDLDKLVDKIRRYGHPA